DAPFVERQRSGLLQDRLGNTNLADVVQQAGLADDIDDARSQAERGRDAPAERRHALGGPARVRVLCLQRVGQAEERLADRALQLAIEPAHVLRVPERLLVRRVETAVVRRRVALYSRCHATRGSRRSTSESSRTGENGLVR